MSNTPAVEATEDQVSTDEQTPNPEAPETEAQGKEASEGETQGQGVESALWEGIPEGHPVRAEVESLRKENASKRTSAQRVKQENETLKASLAEAKTPEQVSELIAEWEGKLTDAELTATRERIGRRHALPDEIVDLLKGDDEEALEAHAESLKTLFGSKSTPAPTAPPRGGKKPADEATSSSSLVNQIKANRR